MINDINNRVKEVRQSMNLSQAKFAQKIGFSQSAIKDVEIGKCKVTDRLILAMNKYLGINEEWLRTGNGSMYAQTDKKDAVEQALNILMAKYNMDKFEIAMMKNYLEMSPEAKQGFKTFLKEVAPTIKAEADEGRVAEGPAGYEAVEKVSNMDSTAEELHQMVDELYEAKDKEPSALDTTA